jgi:hypothetical protein
MVKLLSLLVVFVLSVASHAQDEMPQFSIEYNGIPQGGYYLAAPISRDSFGFIDKSGRVVFTRSVGLHTNLQTYKNKRASAFTGNFGYFVYVVFDSTLTPIDTVSVTSPYYTDSHEGTMWSDSTFLMLGLDYRSFDMSDVVDGGQSNASLMATVIQERHLSTDSVLFEWNAFGRIPVTDATREIDLRQRTIDYIHANSVVRDINGDLIVSCRHLDEIIKIRRSDGSIVWRFGGVGSKNKQFTLVDDDHDSTQGFSHQHTAILTRAGTLMMFDNGNLKPQRRSRVVEYYLDTVAMTATRMWSYTPDPPIYCPSQGSVEELGNGNILVGYSSTEDTRIAEEVDRTGAVVARIRRTSDYPLQPYRVLHTTLGCTSIDTVVEYRSFFWYRDSDSSAGLALELGYLSSPMRSRAELHHYRPHEWSTEDSSVCGPLSHRWTFSYDSSVTVMGGMRFDVSDFALPFMLQLYHRPREGYGPFKLVKTGFDATLNNGALKTLILSDVISGEFALAYPWCIHPTPIYPSVGAVNIPQTTRLRWSEVPDAIAYDLQLSVNESLSSPFVDVTTTRLDTTIRGLAPSTQYHWRVRKRTAAGPGAWSAIYTFTTAATVSVATDTRSMHNSINIRIDGDALHVADPNRECSTAQVFDLLGALIVTGEIDHATGIVRGVNINALPRVAVVCVGDGNGVLYQQVILRP